jgi:serine/threonine protein kinase
MILRERYQAIKIIGQGGFGRTFLAIDKDKPSKPYCVIKQFFPSAQGTETLQKASDLFALEAERLEQLGNHDQIPDLLAYFTHEDNRQYLVQQYIKGPNLLAELETQGQFQESEIRKLLIDLLNVLKYIHEKQVIHRDIKPANIIRRESDHKLVLVDFGAAKHATPTVLGVTATVIGSQQYCAPEQSRGKPEFTSDLYSLGVTCLHLITATNPFDLFDTNENDWVWRDHLQGNAVSQELGDILDKMIQFGVKKRYQSADEVLAVLTNQKVVIAPTQVELKSAKGVDYTKLRNLLAAQKWKEADQETARVMLEAANRTKEGYLDRQSIENFPCEDLRTIDQLWVKYSEGRFGFSVQKQIWLELGGSMM